MKKSVQGKIAVKEETNKGQVISEQNCGVLNFPKINEILLGFLP
jgi:hypothetical protein